MFTLHPNPHHVCHPVHGWLDAEAVAAHDPECECGIHPADHIPQLEGLTERGGWPEPTHPHHVEIDCSTGLVGYTRLTAKQMGEMATSAAAAQALQRVEEMGRQASLDLIRDAARKDPAIAAIARHIGLAIE